MSTRPISAHSTIVSTVAKERQLRKLLPHFPMEQLYRADIINQSNIKIAIQGKPTDINLIYTY